MVELEPELEIAQQAAVAAGAIILRHYARGAIHVDTKADQSPVTAADLDANRAIVDIIRAAFPDDGVLSEELPDSEERFARRRVWIIDPLDGTRDFVARTGEFCVHVGLAVDGVPVVGAVYRPVTATLFAARAGGGAQIIEGGTARALRVSGVAGVSDLAEVRVGVSRLNAAGSLGRWLAASGLAPRAAAFGASVKHMALASGQLDAVVNLSPGEQEWDTCAPEVVVREAGGRFTDGDGRAFRYNQRDLAHRRGSVASNGACHQSLLGTLRPYLDEGG